MYGGKKTNPDEDPPSRHRRNAVLYWKKVESHFMLNQDHQRSEIAMKVYGDEKANSDKDLPVHHQRNTVLYWKKAWFHFMLNQDHQWSEIATKRMGTTSVPGLWLHSKAVLGEKLRRGA